MKTSSLLILLAISSCVAFFVTSCATTPEEETSEKKPEVRPIEISDVELKVIGETYFREFMRGLQEGDRKLFVENLTPDMKEKLSESVFKKLYEQFARDNGKMLSSEYLCSMEHPPFKRLVWKTAFSNNKKGVLTVFLLGKLDGKYKIFGFYFW